LQPGRLRPLMQAGLAAAATMPALLKLVMTSHIIVDGKELKLNRFITELTGNVIDAIARSLKFGEGNNIQFVLEGEKLTMFVDGKEVSLNLGHASQIVGDVLRGLLKHLYGAEGSRVVTFICEK
jgi:hypothetical protein